MRHSCKMSAERLEMHGGGVTKYGITPYNKFTVNKVASKYLYTNRSEMFDSACTEFYSYFVKFERHLFVISQYNDQHFIFISSLKLSYIFLKAKVR